jgi:diadenylate cyclase
LKDITEAAHFFTHKRLGALVVIQRQDEVKNWITTGTPIHAEFSVPLLKSIFPVTSPLHDGAVLINYDIIVSAANILPLTRKTFNKKLGTRHRAAIGLSERTDAIIFVVSEETGSSSFAYQGELYPFQLPNPE